MKIKEISCDQFAGLKGRDYDFEDGLNLIIGENESGKSTLVDLLYHMFFKDISLKGKEKTAFKDLYFPKGTSQYQGDVIDGELYFETDKGTYKLSKEWKDKNPNIKLITPDGTIITDQTKINNIVLESLGYGKGVYDELVFASQRRPQTLLAGLLGNKSSDTVNDISSTIKKAVVETGGIDIDAIENEIQKKLTDYEGKWDFINNMPQDGRRRGINNPWKNGAGSIVNAYYDKERIAQAQKDAEVAEKNVEQINTSIINKREERNQKVQERSRFGTVRGTIAAQTANLELLKEIKDELDKKEKDHSEWPDKSKQLKKAEELNNNLQQSQLKEKYDKVSGFVTERNNVQERLAQIGKIASKDVEKAKQLDHRILKEEATLKGMNIVAAIKQLGSEAIEITSSVTGSPLASENGSYDITEAVNITVPGIVDIQLSPKGVDTETVKQNLQKYRHELDDILKGYNVDSVSSLEKLWDEAKDLRSRLDGLDNKVEAALNGQDWEELEQEAKDIPQLIKSSDDLKKEILELCGNISIDAFIGRIQSDLNKYQEDYDSIEKLNSDIEALKHKVAKLQAKVDDADQIPEEFKSITDPDAYDEILDKKINEIEKTIENLRNDLTSAEKELKDKPAEEYSEELKAAEEKFNSIVEEHKKWKHIDKIFKQVKEESMGNPFEDVENNFRDYLSMLTDGSIVLNSVDEKLGSSISSGTSKLSESILSEGTKDTISLAFRLAMLKNLFPNGGGIAVFDDPFTDMDPKRTAQACRLLQDFAKDNQVLFITCDEKYKDLLEGNEIYVSR